MVEEKRKLIEMQVKEALFDDNRTHVYDWHKDDEHSEERKEEIFPTRATLDPIWIAEKIGDILIEEGCGSEEINAGMAALAEARHADNTPKLATRLPYFYSDCPHNSSTKVPERSRTYADINCHYIIQWMDHNTVGFTQMGGKGTN